MNTDIDQRDKGIIDTIIFVSFTILWKMTHCFFLYLEIVAIAKSIEELAGLFKDLSLLVIEQVCEIVIS